jgi:hypothetical protein
VNAYLTAAYLIVLLSLGGYALNLHLRCLRLRGEE